MKYTKSDLIKYRLDNADKSLEAAKVMAQIEQWNAAANRMYYACFYAVTAYLANENINAKTHKGVKSAFHSQLIKSGLMEEEWGMFYAKLFNRRQEADYEDFLDFNQQELEAFLPLAKDFVQKIKELTTESKT